MKGDRSGSHALLLRTGNIAIKLPFLLLDLSVNFFVLALRRLFTLSISSYAKRPLNEFICAASFISPNIVTFCDTFDSVRKTRIRTCLKTAVGSDC